MHKAHSNKLPHNIQSDLTKSFSGIEHRTSQKNCLKNNILEQLI